MMRLASNCFFVVPILLIIHASNKALAFGATAFSPALPGPTGRHHKTLSLLNIPNIKQRNLPGLLLSNGADDVGEKEDSGPIYQEENTFQEAKVESRDITVAERVRILTYRGSLCTSALLLSAEAILKSDFLSGSGLDGTLIEVLAESYLPLAAGLSLLLAPAPESINIVKLSVGFAAMVLAGAQNLLPAPEELNETLTQLSNGFGIVFLCGISLREIYYFGLEYKWEAAVALVSLPLLLIGDNENLSLVAVPLSALAVSVLAFSKVFEPCLEDYVKSNSEFFVDGNK